MNWGKGIAVALILFIGFIIYLVINMVSQKVDLETEDYYQREIAYESEITAIKNANKADRKVVISTTDSHVSVKFNNEVDYEDIELLLIRPNDKDLDRLFEIEGTKLFTIDKSELENGQYKIELSYKVGEDVCLHKENITIE